MFDVERYRAIWERNKKGDWLCIEYSLSDDYASTKLPLIKFFQYSSQLECTIVSLTKISVIHIDSRASTGVKGYGFQNIEK